MLNEEAALPGSGKNSHGQVRQRSKVFFVRKITSLLVNPLRNRSISRAIPATVTSVAVAVAGMAVPATGGNQLASAAETPASVQALSAAGGGLIKAQDWQQSHVLGALPAPLAGDKDSPEHVKDAVERSVQITRLSEENDSLEQRWRITFNRELIRDDRNVAWAGNKDVKYSVVLSPDYQVVGNVDYTLAHKHGGESVSRSIPATVMGSGDYGYYYNGLGQSGNAFALLSDSARLVELRYFGQYVPTDQLNGRGQQVFNPPEQVKGSSTTNVSTPLANELSGQIGGTDRRGDQLWENLQWKDGRFQGWYVNNNDWAQGSFYDSFAPNAGMAWSFSYATEKYWADDVITVEFTTRRDPSTMWFANGRQNTNHRTFVAASYKAFLGGNALVQRAAAQYTTMDDHDTATIGKNGLPQRINAGVGIPLEAVGNNYDGDDGADQDELGPQGLSGYIKHGYLNLAERNPGQVGNKTQPTWGIDGSDPTVGYAGYILMPNKTLNIAPSYHPTAENALQYATQPHQTVQLWAGGKLLAETKSDAKGLAWLQPGWAFDRTSTTSGFAFRPNKYGNNVRLNDQGQPVYVRVDNSFSVNLTQQDYQLKVYSEGWDTLPAYPKLQRPVFARPAEQSFGYNAFQADNSRSTLTATPNVVPASKSATTTLRLTLQTRDGKPISVQPNMIQLEQYLGGVRNETGKHGGSAWQVVGPGQYETRVGNETAGIYDYKVKVNAPAGGTFAEKTVRVTFNDAELADATVNNLADSYPAGTEINNLTISAQGRRGGLTGSFWVKLPGKAELVKLETKQGAPVAVPAFAATKKEPELKIYADAAGTSLVKTVPLQVTLGAVYRPSMELFAYGSPLTNRSRLRVGTPLVVQMVAKDYDGDLIPGQTGYKLDDGAKFVEDPLQPGVYRAQTLITEASTKNIGLASEPKELYLDKGSLFAILGVAPESYRISWISPPVPLQTDVGGKLVKIVDAQTWQPVANREFSLTYGGASRYLVNLRTDSAGIITLPNSWNGFNWAGTAPQVYLVKPGVTGSAIFATSNLYDSIPVPVISPLRPGPGQLAAAGNLDGTASAVDSGSGALAHAGVNKEVTVTYQADTSQIGGLDFAEVKATLGDQTVTLTASPQLDPQTNRRTYSGKLTAPANGGDYEISTVINGQPGPSTYVAVIGTETPFAELSLTTDKTLNLSLANQDSASVNMTLTQLDGLSFESYQGIGGKQTKQVQISNAKGFSTATTRDLEVLPGWQFRVTAEAAGKGLSRPYLATVKPPAPENVQVAVSPDGTKVTVTGTIAYPGTVAVDAIKKDGTAAVGAGGRSNQLPAGEFSFEIPVPENFDGKLKVSLESYGVRSSDVDKTLAEKPQQPTINSAQLNGNGEVVVSVTSPSAGSVTVAGITKEFAAGETKTVTIPASADINAGNKIAATVTNAGGSATSSEIAVAAAPGAPTATAIKHIGNAVSFEVTVPAGGSLAVISNGATIKTVDNLQAGAATTIEIPDAGTREVTYQLVATKDGVSSVPGTVSVKALPSGLRFTNAEIAAGQITIAGNMPVTGTLKFGQNPADKAPVTWSYDGQIAAGSFTITMDKPAGVTELSSTNSQNYVAMVQEVDGQYLETAPIPYTLYRKLDAPTISEVKWTTAGKLQVTVTGVENGNTVSLKQDETGTETQLASQTSSGNQVVFELTKEQAAGLTKIFAKQDNSNSLLRPSNPAAKVNVPAQPQLENIDVYVDETGVHVTATPTVAGKLKVDGQQEVDVTANTPVTKTFPRNGLDKITLSLDAGDNGVSPTYTFSLAEVPAAPDIAADGIKHNSPNQVELKITPNSDSGTLIVYRLDGTNLTEVLEQEFTSGNQVTVTVPDGGQVLPRYVAKVQKTLGDAPTQTRLLSAASNEVTAPQIPLTPEYTLVADGDKWKLEVTVRESGALKVTKTSGGEQAAALGTTPSNLAPGAVVNYTLASGDQENTAGQPITISFTSGNGTVSLQPVLPTPPATPTDVQVTTDQSLRNNYKSYHITGSVEQTEGQQLELQVQYSTDGSAPYQDVTEVARPVLAETGKIDADMRLATAYKGIRLLTVDPAGNRSVASTSVAPTFIDHKFNSAKFEDGSTSVIKLEYAEGTDVAGVVVRDENDNLVQGVVFDSNNKTVTLPENTLAPGSTVVLARKDSQGNISTRYELSVPGKTGKPAVTFAYSQFSGNWYDPNAVPGEMTPAPTAETLKPKVNLRFSRPVPASSTIRLYVGENKIGERQVESQMSGNVSVPVTDAPDALQGVQTIDVTLEEGGDQESDRTSAPYRLMQKPVINSAYQNDNDLVIVGNFGGTAALVKVAQGENTKYYRAPQGQKITLQNINSVPGTTVSVATGNTVQTSAWSDPVPVADDSVITSWSNTSVKLFAGQSLTSLTITATNKDGRSVSSAPTLQVLHGKDSVFSGAVTDLQTKNDAVLTMDPAPTLQVGDIITVQQLRAETVVSQFQANVQVLGIDSNSLTITKQGDSTEVSQVTADDTVTITYQLPNDLTTIEGITGKFKLVPATGDAVEIEGTVNRDGKTITATIPQDKMHAGTFKVVPVINGLEGEGKSLTIVNGAPHSFEIPAGTQLVKDHDNYVPITVTDAAGNPVAKSTVYVSLNDGTKIAAVTDGKGIAVVPVYPSGEAATATINLFVDASSTDPVATVENLPVLQKAQAAAGSGELVVAQIDGTALDSKQITVGSTVAATYTYHWGENASAVIPSAVAVRLGDGTAVTMARENVDYANGAATFVTKKLVAPTKAGAVAAVVVNDLLADPEEFTGYTLVADQPARLVLAEPNTKLVKDEADQTLKVKITDQYGNEVTPTGVSARGAGQPTVTAPSDSAPGVYTVIGLKPTEADHQLSVTVPGVDSPLTVTIPLAERVYPTTGTFTVNAGDTVGEDVVVSYQLPAVGVEQVLDRPETVKVKVQMSDDLVTELDLTWNENTQAYDGTVSGQNLHKAGSYTLTPVLDDKDVTDQAQSISLHAGPVAQAKLVADQPLIVGQEQQDVQIKLTDQFDNLITPDTTGAAQAVVRVAGKEEKVDLGENGVVSLPALTPGGTQVPVAVTVGGATSVVNLPAFNLVDNTTGSFVALQATVPAGSPVQVTYQLPDIDPATQFVAAPDKFTLYLNGDQSAVKLNKTAAGSYTGEWTPQATGEVTLAVGTSAAATQQGVTVVSGKLSNSTTASSGLVKDVLGSATFVLTDTAGNQIADGTEVAVKIEDNSPGASPTMITTTVRGGRVVLDFTPRRAGQVPVTITAADGSSAAAKLTVLDRQLVIDGILSIAPSGQLTTDSEATATWTLNEPGDKGRGPAGTVVMKIGETVLGILLPVNDPLTNQFTGKYEGKLNTDQPVTGPVTVETADGELQNQAQLQILPGKLARAEVIEPANGFALTGEETEVQIRLTDAKGNDLAPGTPVQVTVAGATVTAPPAAIAEDGLLSFKVKPETPGDINIGVTVAGNTATATITAVDQLPISAGMFTVNGVTTNSSIPAGASVELKYVLPSEYTAADVTTIYPVVDGKVLTDQPLQLVDGQYTVTLTAPAAIGTATYSLAFDEHADVKTKEITVNVIPAVVAKVELLSDGALRPNEPNQVQFQVADQAGKATTAPVWVSIADGKFVRLNPDQNGVLTVPVTPTGGQAPHLVIAADEQGTTKLFDQTLAVKPVPDAATDVTAVVTKRGEVTVTGTVQPGATVQIQVPGQAEPVTVTADPVTGQFTTVIPGIKPGATVVVVPVVDGVAGKSTAVKVVVPKPAAQITGDTISGTTIPGGKVVVTDAAGNKIAEQTADEDGKFTLVVPGDAAGQIRVNLELDDELSAPVVLDHQVSEPEPANPDQVQPVQEDRQDEGTPNVPSQDQNNDRCSTGSAGSSCGFHWWWLIPVILLVLGIGSYVQYTAMVNGGDRQPLQRGQGSVGDWIRWLQGLPVR